VDGDLHQHYSRYFIRCYQPAGGHGYESARGANSQYFNLLSITQPSWLVFRHWRVSWLLFKATGRVSPVRQERQTLDFHFLLDMVMLLVVPFMGFTMNGFLVISS
jgi:hypothetical protein